MPGLLRPLALSVTAAFACLHPSPSRAGIVTIAAGGDAATLADAGQSRVERRVAHIGLREIDLPVRALPARVPRRENLCLNRRRDGYPKPTCNSCEKGYGDCVWSAVDGVPWEGDFEWSSDYRNPDVPFYQVEFGRVVTLGKVRVWLRRGYEMADFDVRWRSPDGVWHDAATVRGNREELRTFALPTVRADAAGVHCVRGPDHQPTIRRILELEAFAPATPAPRSPSSFAYRLDLPASGAAFVEVREAYGEGDTLREVDYEVRLDGRLMYHRKVRCDGPGPVSYAIPVPASLRGKRRLTFVDTSGRGVAVARVRVLPEPVALARKAGLLEPLIVAPRIELHPPYTQPEPEQALRAWVEAAESARGSVRVGLLAIVGFADPDARAVSAKIEAYAALARRVGVPWVLQLSSWWADTPLRVPDGLGGTFGDIRYQQIGYSRFGQHEDPALKAFVDAEMPGTYTPHYGLTVPNLWSNTPWLTMSNARLNAFKVDCLRRAVDVVNDVRKAPGGELLTAIVTDDEPIYWPRITDWLEQGYQRVNGGVIRSDLVLDFNPAVVRAAAADGVRLDPTDGVSPLERQWLADNNARYEALICRTIHDRLAPAQKGDAGPDLRERIFNYLLAQPLYPLDDFGHPGFEMGMVPHAAIGLEAGDERYFARARDLGPLANSDFECALPSAETTATWEPRFRAWYDAGCRFVQLCNPGPAANWRGLFRQLGGWSAPERETERALSLLVQQAATGEWRQARFRPSKASPARR